MRKVLHFRGIIMIITIIIITATVNTAIKNMMERQKAERTNWLIKQTRKVLIIPYLNKFSF